MGTASVVVFLGRRLLGHGALEEVLALIPNEAAAAADDPLAVFDERTGQRIHVSTSARKDRLKEGRSDELQRAGRGRPRLGVIGREVTLLPRHWAWLDEQAQGASAVLRHLVEQAMRGEGAGSRQMLDAIYGPLSTVAGNLEGFEEAVRALYRMDEDGFAQHTRTWAKDVRSYFRARLREAASRGERADE
ncbi:DUF2239 family protein [Aquabacterium sp. A7-Y]|uniref:DUF2239 family protein n=1 Tax=Aquabacterium sp. A7-Y TaxID=1349605 RepID=UPI00223E0597|nr:DUF2239 family protein [Aquabacterium sp. A7-Y]MCW7539490.1 DUF2239 family protein [Aquabacterium sp. A7-Y]